MPEKADWDASDGSGAGTGGVPSRWAADDAEWLRIRSQGLREQAVRLLARAARAESAALTTCAVAERLLGGRAPQIDASPADARDGEHDLGGSDVSDVEEPASTFGSGGDRCGATDRLAMADQHPDFQFGLVHMEELFQIWVEHHGLSVLDAREELWIALRLNGYPAGTETVAAADAVEMTHALRRGRDW